MKPPADSAAGARGANGSAASRTHRPRGDDPPAAADGEAAEAIEAHEGSRNVRLSESHVTRVAIAVPVAGVPFC